MQGHKCKIVGYPPEIPFISPSMITSLPRMHALHDGWMDGSIHWVRMTMAEVKEHAADLEKHCGEGGIVGKKRKTRVTKKKVLEEGSSDESDKENTRPSKRAKRMKGMKGMKGMKTVRVQKKTAKKPAAIAAQMPPRSASVVVDSSDEEGRTDNGLPSVAE